MTECLRLYRINAPKKRTQSTLDFKYLLFDYLFDENLT